MKFLIDFIKSSIGRKYLMAASGLALVGFIIIHMIGNIKIFHGADELNHYAHMLKYRPEVLWAFRLGLLGIAVVHIATAVSLILENRAARPKNYENQRTMKATFASISMAMSGLTVLFFIVYHILHFTVKAFHPEYHEMVAPIHAEPGIFQTLAPVQSGVLYDDVYRMMVAGFSNAWISAFYIISVGLLCLHMSHGIASMFQSIGLRSEKTGCCLDWIARGTSAVIFIGMSSIPVAILLGCVR